MTALFVLMACLCADDQAVRPKLDPAPVIPIPNGPTLYDYWLGTDWTPFSRSRPVWRSGRRLEDSGVWEEAEVGQQGGRLRVLVGESPDDRLTATTGRCPAGAGSLGAGFEWSVFVGSSWTAGLDIEFTSAGPRVVVVLTYFPYEGVNQSYGWSVLTGELVQRSRWYLSADELSIPYLLIPWALRMQFDAFLKRYR